MILTRKDSRCLAMTIIYQLDLYQKKNIEYDLADVIASSTPEDADISFVRELVDGVLEHNNELEELANKYLKNWTIDRLGLTDGAILKLAIYELKYMDTPNKVVIDEAIELAHDYSDESVVGMINSVLDKVYHEELDGE